MNCITDIPTCIICKKTRRESNKEHKLKLHKLTGIYCQSFYKTRLPRECAHIIAEYVIGNDSWYSMETWNWTHYTSYFEKDYDYTISYTDACISCLQMTTLAFYNIYGCTPCKLSEFLGRHNITCEIPGEIPDEIPSEIRSLKNVYFRDFVCDGWRNTPPYYQKNLLGENFITI